MKRAETPDQLLWWFTPLEERRQQWKEESARLLAASRAVLGETDEAGRARTRAFMGRVENRKPETEEEQRK